jgi:hypothetical protein
MTIKSFRLVAFLLFLALSTQGCKAQPIINQPTEGQISKERSIAQEYIDSRYNTTMPRFYLDRLAPSVKVHWNPIQGQSDDGTAILIMEPVVTPRISSPITFGLAAMYLFLTFFTVMIAGIKLEINERDEFHSKELGVGQALAFIVTSILAFILMRLYFYHFNNGNWYMPVASASEGAGTVALVVVSFFCGLILTAIMAGTGYSLFLAGILTLVSLPIFIFSAIVRFIWIPMTWPPLESVDADRHVFFGFAMFGAVVLSGLTFSAIFLGAAGYVAFQRLREKVRSALVGRQLRRIHRQSEAEAEAASISDVVEHLRLLDTHLNSLQFATRSTDKMMIIGLALNVIDHLTSSAEMSGFNPEAIKRLEDWISELEKPELSDPVLKKRFMRMYEKFKQS